MFIYIHRVSVIQKRRKSAERYIIDWNTRNTPLSLHMAARSELDGAGFGSVSIGSGYDEGEANSTSSDFWVATWNHLHGWDIISSSAASMPYVHALTCAYHISECFGPYLVCTRHSPRCLQQAMWKLRPLGDPKVARAKNVIDERCLVAPSVSELSLHIALLGPWKWRHDRGVRLLRI